VAVLRLLWYGEVVLVLTVSLLRYGEEVVVVRLLWHDEVFLMLRLLWYGEVVLVPSLLLWQGSDGGEVVFVW